MRPRFKDDGSRPELDLHGCTVNEAVQLTRRLIIESARYGRNSICLIHGKSTSTPGKRTIKSAITELIESQEFERSVSSSLKYDGYMIVGLRRVSGQPDLGRMSLRTINRS